MGTRIYNSYTTLGSHCMPASTSFKIVQKFEIVCTLYICWFWIQIHSWFEWWVTFAISFIFCSEVSPNLYFNQFKLNQKWVKIKINVHFFSVFKTEQMGSIFHQSASLIRLQMSIIINTNPNANELLLLINGMTLHYLHWLVFNECIIILRI